MSTDILQNPYCLSAAGRLRERIWTFPVLLLAAYLLVEYGRPRYLFPIKPGILIQGMLVACLLPHRAMVSQVMQHRFFRLYLALLVYMTLHVFIAANNYYAFQCLKLMVSYLIIGVACCVFLDSLKKLNAFLTVFVVVMTFCAINRIGGANILGIAGRGVFGDENDFALAMNVALPIAFFVGRVQTGWRKWFFWFAGVSFVLANMVTASRGGFVGLVIVGAICWLSSRYRLRAIPVVVVLAALAWNFAPPLAREKISGIGFDSAQKDTGRDRIELWKVGWKAFVDNPVIGVGQGNIMVVMNKYRYDRLGRSFWNKDMWGRMTHSVYFTLLPELGLVGLVLFVLMLKELYARKKRIDRISREVPAGREAACLEEMSSALFVAMIGFLVSGVFLSVLYYPPLWNLAALTVALALVAARVQKQQPAAA